MMIAFIITCVIFYMVMGVAVITPIYRDRKKIENLPYYGWILVTIFWSFLMLSCGFVDIFRWLKKYPPDPVKLEDKL